MIRSIREVIVKQKDNYVEYIIDGKIYSSKIASADHVIDKQFGGSNKPENIVLACRQCNNKKEIMKSKLLKAGLLNVYLGRVRVGIIKY